MSRAVAGAVAGVGQPAGGAGVRGGAHADHNGPVSVLVRSPEVGEATL